MQGRWRYLVVLAGLLAMELVGLGLFSKGFFPYKKSIPGFASPVDRPVDMRRIVQEAQAGSVDMAPIGQEEKAQKATAQYGRLVLMVVDALRNDFVFGNESAMAYTQSLLRTGQAVGFTARAQAPTVTLPRIKALMTGTVPGFLDAVLNIAESDSSASLQHQDNLLWQLKTHGDKRINMFGDDTWLRLFPGLFDRTDGTSSFMVTDTVEVDVNVTRNVRPELERDGWGVTVLHYLGLDHIGHLAGPRSALMAPKQREMDAVVEDIHAIIRQQDARRQELDAAAKPTLLVLLGDHAMNELGNHGGNSQLETSTVLVFVGQGAAAQKAEQETAQDMAQGTEKDDRGRNALSTLLKKEVAQVNLVPTLALLFGVPIPKNSVGVPLSELLAECADTERLYLLQTAATQLFGVVRANDATVAAVDAREVARGRSQYAAARNCAHLSADSSLALQCMFEVALTEHARAASTSGGNASDAAERAYYAFMEQASTQLSQAFSGYDVRAMGAGLGVLGLAVAGLAALYQGAGEGLVHIKSRRLVVRMAAAVLWATYLVSVLSSSLVEEEHQFWYFWVQTLFALHMATSGGAWRTLAQMAVFRVVRAWNQTGQQWAGEPGDVRQLLSAPQHVHLLWLLAAATVVLVSASAFRRHWHSRATLWPRLWCVLVSYGSLCAFAYHAERVQACQSLGGLVGRLCAAACSLVPAEVAHMAQTVYLTTLLQVVVSGVTIFKARPDAVAAVHMATSDALVGIMPLLLLLSRPQNFALFALFLAMRALLSPPSQDAAAHDFREGVELHQQFALLRPPRMLILLSLVHASFFALGNSNSLASLDLSNAYAGVSRYSEAAVGLLLFVANWAAPLWWALATLADVAAHAHVHRVTPQTLARRLAGLTAAAHLWQATALLAISVVATLMRSHLFVWSVFSPRYLYQIAWFVPFYLICGTFVPILWLSAVVLLNRCKGNALSVLA
ncbi:alkaline phosphatase-like protein [Coemansia reversa NRRL 1564]|uniref:GPI ethanolamine phosphate transferase 2 n=1 Tax=Coemansia reversa (strain ATCC 12441 / NRRL 1564) TaxID=763665 RepID=A0A2G5BJZ0_COERN|nr:alkaline phosphatase-like protein [Coemansia reversa NRRL 1564]|eukprot:PIA19311.1 alkaline phosphatase-like protein [Coemansia reversa NRRL 1564]